MVKALLNKVLVTGSNGFVGRGLCQALRHRGISVIEATRTARSSEQISVGDIGASTNWQTALSGCDTVFHLAARVHVMNDQMEDPLAAYREVNTAGTVNLAEQAIQAGIRRFVFVSSVKVLGEEGRFYAHSVPHPLDPYGVSKLEAELKLLELAKNSDMAVTILRPPLVYGPGVGANFLKLLQAVRNGMPLPLGLAANKRSLIYIGNLVDALIACSSHQAARNKTYLIDDGETVSTVELVKGMAEALNVRSRLIPVPVALIRMAAALVGKNQAAQRVFGSLTVDSSQIKQDINWQAPYSRKQGLAATAAWLNTLTISR